MDRQEFQNRVPGEHPRGEDQGGRRELERELERYRRFFHTVPVGHVRETSTGEILEANQALAGLLGHGDPEVLRGRGVRELFADPDDAERSRARLLREGEVEPRDVRLLRTDGTAVWVQEHTVLIPVAGSGQTEIMRSLVDVDGRRTRERGLEKLAYHDELTGLANRRLLEIRAEQTLALADRRGIRCSVVFMDLVDFKMVNDRLGHSAGDRLLVHVARRLERALRTADTVARIGGDEFAVLLSEVEGLHAAVRAANRLLGHVAAATLVSGRSVMVEARAGVSVFPDDAEDFPTLLSLADRALIRAKGGAPAVVPAVRP